MNTIADSTEVRTATTCNVEGCTLGDAHEMGVPEDEVLHMLESKEFSQGQVQISPWVRGKETGCTLYEDGVGDMTPAELREMATVYEALPSWLRRQADEIEARAPRTA